MVQCSSLTKVEEKACGSVVHEIDKLLIPPSKTIWQLLEEDSRLSIFKSILEGTETEEKLKDPNQNLTLIATTNYGFGRYKYNFDNLKENKTLADVTLKRHLIKSDLFCFNDLVLITDARFILQDRCVANNSSLAIKFSVHGLPTLILSALLK